MWMLWGLLVTPLLLACANAAVEGRNESIANGFLSWVNLASFSENEELSNLAKVEEGASSGAAGAGRIRRLAAWRDEDAASWFSGLRKLAAAVPVGGRFANDFAVRRSAAALQGRRRLEADEDISAEQEKQKVGFFFTEVDRLPEVAPYLSILSAGGAFLYFLFVLVFKHRTIARAAEELDAASITPADFTVMVSALLFAGAIPLDFESRRFTPYSRVPGGDC